MTPSSGMPISPERPTAATWSTAARRARLATPSSSMAMRLRKPSTSTRAPHGSPWAAAGSLPLRWRSSSPAARIPRPDQRQHHRRAVGDRGDPGQWRRPVGGERGCRRRQLQHRRRLLPDQPAPEHHHHRWRGRQRHDRHLGSELAPPTSCSSRTAVTTPSSARSGIRTRSSSQTAQRWTTTRPPSTMTASLRSPTAAIRSGTRQPATVRRSAAMTRATPSSRRWMMIQATTATSTKTARMTTTITAAMVTVTRVVPTRTAATALDHQLHRGLRHARQITSRTTVEGKRDAAMTIIFGQSFGGA